MVLVNVYFIGAGKAQVRISIDRTCVTEACTFIYILHI